MSDTFVGIVTAMLEDPPDPNEPIPFSNKRSTIYGVTIPFHWYQSLTACQGTEYGLGRHLIYSFKVLKPTMILLWLTNAAFHTTTACIKISLILQYLRMFKDGVRRKICVVLLTMVVIWGLAFSFMAWFPCFPVSTFWDRLNGGRCYGFGFRTAVEAKNFILAFAATNMILDTVIYCIPLTEFFRQDLKRRQLLAMTGLFSLGSVVVLMAVLRLWSTFKHNESRTDSFDFTFWYPQPLIFSCLEIDFAIMCASMPIFWPTVVASWSHIFVTNEVRVTSHERLPDESQDNFELQRTNSTKSQGSTKALARSRSAGDAYYNGYDAETGKDGRFAVMQVEVQPQQQVSRRL
ncbi:conserved hypothetical protein [Pyrenophora tritici-repentis Pt-1C-BFP]|uniref:Rhodopsin domain-containing protein n=1 Tax=Pyrenophora tritici-repentis (strain Pt-1C-BFP) TaxID=426418 RepID=B2WFF2_PYRTR|nr:uncharacterized protein PTRG_09220 [Pyrenophora tritici-repentis Pt-1C-BFP]EDU42271.1 conserved hypothetical protein [Pyrenophora tritici-repentis Pt-1C-BFP]